MSDAPPEVVALAERRAAARAAKDFGTSDALRDEIAAAGWLVKDTPGGYDLAPKPPYDVHPTVATLPDSSAEHDTRPVTVALLADGLPAGVPRCVDALLAHTSACVLVLEVGGTFHDDRVETLHVDA